MPYSDRILQTEPASLVSYLPLSEQAGSIAHDLSGNGLNGAYTGVTLGEAGIGDGRTSPFFDGVLDYVSWYSAGLAAAFSGAEGTMAFWFKVGSSGTWTDGLYRRMCIISVDANNRVHILKSGTANLIEWQYIAGGTVENMNTASNTTTDWIHLAITWSAAADEVKGYQGGVQISATRTLLGTWSGALSSTGCVIGAQSTVPDFVTDGYIAHAALWSKALTAAQVAHVAGLMHEGGARGRGLKTRQQRMQVAAW